MQNKRISKLRKVLEEITQDWHEAESIVVKFANEPTNDVKRLQLLSESVVCEGKTKEHSGGFLTRFDNRTAKFGGGQLHIEGPHGEKWAYRSDGSRSEPNKYKLPTTKRIRELVSQHFGIDKDQIQEMLVRCADSKSVLVEVTFK